VSDDPGTALSMLRESGLPASVHVESSPGTDDWSDLLTLASGRVLLASNSSFSWWGGYVGYRSHGMHVVVPRPWFTDPGLAEPDLFPTGWLRRERSVL
jgi:hypothetical protein